jgi:hypothetical protein
MKKLQAVILTAAMLLTLAACTSDNEVRTGGRDRDRDSETTEATEAPSTPEMHEEVANSRAYAALSILSGDTYSLHINMLGMLEIEMYRRGDDISFIMLGVRNEMIVDGMRYEFDLSTMNAYYEPVTDEMRDEIMENFAGFDTILELDRARLTGSGVMDFLEFGELEYEEFTLENGEIRRAFFNEAGELLGVHTDVSGDVLDIGYHITQEFPDWVFEVPDDYELVERSEIESEVTYE